MIERKYYLNESDFDYDRMERLIEIEEVAQKIYEVFRDRLSYEDTLRSLFIEVSQSPYLSAVYQYHTN